MINRKEKYKTTLLGHYTDLFRKEELIGDNQFIEIVTYPTVEDLEDEVISREEKEF